MSGYDPSDVARNGNPAHPHVRKPFTIDDLLKAIDSTRRK